MYTANEIIISSDQKKQAKIAPITEFIYVKASDIGLDYVSGSEGQIKILKEYSEDGVSVYSITTFLYQDSDYPTKLTRMEVV
jgi:hypothetical protein